jgi:hypothetical protein
VRVLQAALPLPPLPPEARRLFPDRGARDVDAERRRAGRAALAAILAAQALLSALVLKLKVSAAFADAELARGGGVGGPARPAEAAPRGAYATSVRAQLPAGLAQHPVVASALDSLPTMDGAGNAAMATLSKQGLAWMPTATNAFVGISFGIAVFLNFEIGGTGLCHLPTHTAQAVPRVYVAYLSVKCQVSCLVYMCMRP